MIFDLRLVLSLCAVVAFVGIVGVSRYQVWTARAELAETKEAASKMRASLEQQNEAIERWRQLANERVQQTSKARKTAKVNRKKSEDSAARLRSFSAANMGECDALRTLVDLDRGR